MKLMKRLSVVLTLGLLAPLGVMLAPAAGAQEPIRITMWLAPTGEQAFGAECVYTAAVAPFNNQGNGITVGSSMQDTSWDITRAALEGGPGPDIIGTPGPSFAAQLALAGLLVDLGAYAREYGWADRFASNSLNLGMVDGTLYSIPSEIETLVLYYNKTLFEQHGWEVPRTLDELMSLSQTISSAGIVPFAHGNADWRPANEWYVGEFLNHGAGPQKVHDALAGKTPWTDPAFAASIDMLATMQRNGWFSGGLDGYHTTTFSDAANMLGDGRAAMKIEGSWLVEDLKNNFGGAAGNSNDWDWAPAPSADGSTIFDIGIGQTYSIKADSEHPEAAAKFLDYYFSPETQARLLAQCGLAPAPVDLTGQDLSGVDPRFLEILAAVNEAYAANTYGYTTWTFWPPQTETYLIDAIEKVWSGDMTVAEYLEGMQSTFDAETAAGTLPPLPAR
ncbi:MAG: extracellular solute-binding protein [Thermomicrobiales bacterium]